MPKEQQSGVVVAEPAKVKPKNLLAYLYEGLGAWPDIKLEEKKLFIDRLEPVVIAEETDEHFLVRRVVYYVNENAYETIPNPDIVKISKKLKSEDQLNIVIIKPDRYWINRVSTVKKVLFLSFDMRILEIGRFERITITPASRYVKLPAKIFFDMVADITIMKQRGDAYKTSVERYLTNRLIKKYRNRDIQNVTTSTKGEFNFLVNRFNLPIKKRVQDFQKYLDDNDINAVQELTKAFIFNGVFKEDFLRALDDYFIKDKLRGIVTLGRKVLKFVGKKLNTRLAVYLIGKISPNKEVKQLETLWQRFFEKNLLYLIFSYKQVFPKIGLQIEGEVKFPDFVGVNHYNGVDIIEIKTHLTPALVYDRSHKNFSFSPDLSKAIIQTTNYMDAIRQDHFNADEDREKIEKYTDKTNLFRPRGIIIISSWPKIIKNQKIRKKHDALLKRDFTKLRNSLDGIEILTFDEVLDIADTYAKNILKDQTS